MQLVHSRNSDPAERIGPTEIHVRAAPLSVPPERLNQLRLTLSGDEVARAGRFRFEHLQNQYVVAHGTLRTHLSFYLGIPPSAVQFQFGKNGKPSLAGTNSRLQFNMSHSGEIAVYAFALDCELGVDVERIRPIPDMEQIANRFFAAEESADLAAVDESHRREAFYACWTRKEAYIKATGEGLSAPLDAFRVTLRPGVPAAFLYFQDNPSEAEHWSLESFTPAEGYAGALAFRQRGRTVQVWPQDAALATRPSAT